MFNRSFSGPLGFGSANTSTPTSTPAPTINNQFPQKNTSLFGNVNNNNNNLTTSTPSPSLNLFGNKSTQTGQTGTGLFGGATKTTGNLFGGSNTGTFQAGSTSTPSLTTGLFKNNNVNASTNLGGSTNTTTGGLFGNSSTNAAATNTGGLFGSKPSVGTTSTTTKAPLFGNLNTGAAGTGTGTGTFSFGTTGSSGGAAGSTSTGGGLFGGKPSTLGTTGTSTNTGLFGNKPLFSSGTASTSMAQGTTPGGGLFGNRNTLQTNFLQNVPPPNPYGLKVGNVGISLSNMPSSITGETHGRRELEERTERDINASSDTKRSHSISFASSSSSGGILSPVSSKIPPPSLFSKLSSRLSTIAESSTEGVFSPSNSDAWSGSIYWGRSRDEPSKLVLSKVSSTFPPSSRNSPLNHTRGRDISNLLRLRIDPTRIASKKLKLFSGKAVTTKESSNAEIREQTSQSSEHILMTSASIEPNVDIESKEIPGSDNSASNKQMVGQKNSNTDTSNVEPGEKIPTNTSSNGYWCSPSIEQLLNMSIKQLSSVPDFVIGRKGYGAITFNYDVNLADLADDLENNLFGNVVIFNPTKTVEVYPDPETKPPVGQGLNVPATITIEKVYPIDKRTKKVIKDVSNSSETQKLVKKLKKMGGMEFISYNPFGGVWTFRVKHFSIWGLVDEMDAEVSGSESESDEDMGEGTNSREQVNGAQYPTYQQPLVKAENYKSSEEVIITNTVLLSNDANEIITEKQYEPQIDEADFDILEDKFPLDISADWVEQLKLAGSSICSVYAQQHSSEKANADNMHILFTRFNRDYELLEKAKKSMKITSPDSFVRFTPNSTILFKKPSEASGVCIKEVKSKLSRKDLIMKDSEIFKHLRTLNLEPRATNKFPCVKSGSWKFEDILSHISSTESQYNLWKLCSILFDPIELPYDVENQTTKEALTKQRRFESLCNWVVEQIMSEVRAKMTKTSDPLDQIFYHILLNDPLGACKAATASRNVHLAPLLTFLGSNDPRVRDMAVQQLQIWEKSGHQVDPKIQRIYHVLGGTFFESKLYLNKMANEFSWMTIFGLGLFYSMIDENTLENVVASLLALIGTQENNSTYSVLQIFSHQKPTDMSLLVISGVGTKNTDIQFQWYFSQVLKFSGILNTPDIQSDKITLQFVEDLLSSNHVEQALMVACFLVDDKTAKAQISTIVSHNIASLYEQDLQFLIDLKIPETFIYESLAQYNRYCGDHLSELKNLLKAGLYSEAEKVALVDVGPDLILAHNYFKNVNDLLSLKDILDQFPKLQMASWDEGLGVYEEYLKFVIDDANSSELKDSIEKGVELLFQNHKHCKNVPACCDLIQKRIKAIMI